MKDLQIDDYNPWGKPGHGAPNEDTLRKRKIFMEVLPPVVLKVLFYVLRVLLMCIMRKAIGETRTKRTISFGCILLEYEKSYRLENCLVF